jgi:hypothetical protein
MSDTSTRWMIEQYVEQAPLPLFLSGYFQSPPKNFHTTEKVEIDVRRSTEEVAVVITDLAAGARNNENNKLTNKAFTPPIYNEKGSVRAWDMMKRRAGANPFADINYMANAKDDAFELMGLLHDKIQRAIELQASQVLQTGQLALTDQNGSTLYSLNYAPKSSHFPTTGTTWATDGATGDPMGDISSLGDVVRRDGKRTPTDLVFGKGAWQRFKANAKVKDALNQTGVKEGTIAHESRGQGASYKGTITIDHYEYRMWLYDGYYAHPQTGTLTNYVGDDKVIMLCNGARLDLSYGAIPRITPPEARALAFLPTRVSDSGKGLDASMHSYVAQDGSAIFVEVGTRPLCIPTAIDTFACLDVVI